MKKLILILVLLFTFFSDVLSQNDVMYIYRNDGFINAFLKTEIDSIRYSQLDTDSIAHTEFVTQEVWTADSTYRIPLSMIDSVGLVTPPTIYQDGAKPIDGSMLAFIIGSDSLILYFDTQTPNYILPSIGEKLVFDQVTSVLPHGFLGQVNTITNEYDKIIVSCNALALTDVYVQYYSFNSIGEDGTSVRSRGVMTDSIKTWGPFEYTPSPVKIDFTHIISPAIKYKDVAIKVDRDINATIAPRMIGNAYCIVSEKLGTVFNVKIEEEDIITFTNNISGSLTFQKDFGKDIAILLPIPWLGFYGELGLFYRAKGDIICKHSHTHTFRYGYSIDVCSKNFYVPQITCTHVSFNGSNNTEIMIDGSIEIGAYGELGIAYAMKDIASMALRAEIGYKLGGDAVLLSKDTEHALHSTNLYNSLVNTNIHTKWFYSVGAQANVLNFGWSRPINSLSNEGIISKISVVPVFSETKLTRTPSGSNNLLAESKVSGYSLPVDLGFTLFEGNMLEGVSEEGTTKFCNYDYHGPSTQLSSLFSETSTSSSYIVYPTVKLWDITMLANPAAVENNLRELLIRFYQSTNGDNWIRNDNWCTDEPIENWYGVSYSGPELISIQLSNNNLTGSADLSGFKNLHNLGLDGNRLSKLNVRNCTSLERLWCNDGTLTSIDASGCISLDRLWCNNNNLTSLDVSGCSSLDNLICHNNKLTALDLSRNYSLEYLECYHNNLAALDISGAKLLKKLDCKENNLTSLDLSDFTLLKELYCCDNNLTSINVSNNKSLELFWCTSNNLVALDVSDCPSLHYLYCGYNELSSIEMSAKDSLISLDCQHNNLTDIDLSGYSALETLSVESSNLLSLDVSNCTSLIELQCFQNSNLASLNVSGCTKLNTLFCHENNLSSLDVSGCVSLEILWCSNNNLSSLDLSGCNSINQLYCSHNRINHVIDGIFDTITSFGYDQKYSYWYDGNGVLHTETNDYGWWYPGEPEKGYHGK